MSSNTDINFRRQQYQIETDTPPFTIKLTDHSQKLTFPVWISPKHWNLVQQYLKEDDQEYFAVHLNLSVMFSLDNAVTSHSHQTVFL